MQATANGLFEAAYLEHGTGLVRHLAFLTRDRDLAEDLAHEAFLRLAREIDAGRCPDSVGAWLHRVGRNLLTSAARREQVVSRREPDLPRPAQPLSPESVAEGRELGTALSRVLAELSSSEQRVLLMSADGIGGIEIAAQIGRTPGATRTLLCRARAKVRERLGLVGFAQA